MDPIYNDSATPGCRGPEYSASHAAVCGSNNLPTGFSRVRQPMLVMVLLFLCSCGKSGGDEASHKKREKNRWDFKVTSTRTVTGVRSVNGNTPEELFEEKQSPSGMSVLMLSNPDHKLVVVEIDITANPLKRVLHLSSVKLKVDGKPPIEKGLMQSDQVDEKGTIYLHPMQPNMTVNFYDSVAVRGYIHFEKKIPLLFIIPKTSKSAVLTLGAGVAHPVSLPN